jgi:hypothetical protein
VGVFPQAIGFNNGLIHVTTGSTCSIGGIAIKGNGVNAGQVWPSANLAIYIPFRLAAPYTFNSFSVPLGTASGNYDLGVYTEDGTKLISTGSQVAVSNMNTVSVTSTRLPAGLYYLAMSADNVLIAPFALNSMANAALLRAIGVVQQATAFPLPATATFAAYAQVMVPYIGISGRSVI